MDRLEGKAEVLAKAGYDPVLIRPNGCPRKKTPHVCVNCTVGVLWVK